jgi:general nucleoside transport system permease protein
VMALVYIGGETAQISMSLPGATTAVFQGMFLFFLLACDVLVNYRPRWTAWRLQGAKKAAPVATPVQGRAAAQPGE